jgi:hypothetical protein
MRSALSSVPAGSTAGSYLSVRLTGFANVVPVGPKSNGVPLTTRGSFATDVEGATDTFVVEVTASGGTTISTRPDPTFNVAPVLETTPPSRTVTVAVAVFPSTPAVMLAVPGAIPTTIPDDETAALPASELVQVNTRDNACPDWSLATADNWKLAAGTRVAVAADMTTVAVVGVGGSVGPSPQEPRSHPRVISPRVR